MMKNGHSLTVIQLNDSHAYFDLHQEVFWLGGRAVYRPAGGYARIATLVKQIRAANGKRVLFCDCGDTLHGTYPAQSTQGQAMVPVLNSLGVDAMTAHCGNRGTRKRETDLFLEWKESPIRILTPRQAKNRPAGHVQPR